MTEAEAVAQSITARLSPLDRELGLAWWESSTKASPEADARRAAADLARRDVLADPDAFAAVRDARAANPTNRELVVLHDAMLPQQLPGDLRRELVDLETSVDAQFTAYRADLNGTRVDDNTLLEILRSSDDSGERRAAWEAGKQIGAEVGDDVRTLARLRNDAARALGFRDHFELALATSELDEFRLFATLREVDELTAAPFRTWKAALDDQLALRFGVDANDLAPWHLDDPFFQDPPASGAVDLDPYFTGADLEAFTTRTYRGLGLDTDPVLARSDLYAREGKSQHAFCIHIDREGDVRVLCNVEPNERWADTMLHEFGHAVYDRDLDPELPWLLREPAHALTTEGIAMMFGRLVRDPVWLRDVAGVAAADVDALAPQLAAAQRASLLVFARWVLVVTHFEQQLYANPDADLDTIWWDLVERFQLIRRPVGRHAPDWAAKIHLAVVPVYYQNYLYGELFASQLMERLTNGTGREDGASLVDRPSVGAQLHQTVFRAAAGQRWDALIEDATGAPLNARAFARDLDR